MYPLPPGMSHTHNLYHDSNIVIRSKSPMTVHYHGDGSGRDTYAINNDGGMHAYEYRGPHDFGKNLR